MLRTRRTENVTPVNWVMVASELQRDWRLPTAKAMAQRSMSTVKITMLMDNFQAHTKQAVVKK